MLRAFARFQRRRTTVIGEEIADLGIRGPGSLMLSRRTRRGVK